MGESKMPTVSKAASRTGRRPRENRSGFTLVEVLVVLVIIGILMGFLVPMVFTAIRKGRVTQIRVEITQLSQAVEAFKNKYGAYPPDGSNPVITARVIRKMFPRILPAEFAQAMTVLQALDPAEALPFWLRGFSSDPKRPFFGPGGPFNITTERNNEGFFEFQEARLTVRLANPATGVLDNTSGIKWSYDEELVHGRQPAENDVFPIYFFARYEQPFVYFDSRTYIHQAGNGPAAPVPHWPPQGYQNSTLIMGHALPYRTDTPRRATPTDPILREFANAKTFQIISAGLDEDYGEWGGATISATVAAWPNAFKRFPSRTGFTDGDDTAVTNFADGMLKDGAK